MSTQWSLRQHVEQAQFLGRWILLAVPLGIVVGSTVAFFLWSLNWATEVRESTTTSNGVPWLLYLLPVAGVGIVGLYLWAGKSADRGNNLIMDEIHQPGGGVPARMAPLVLVTTVVTHLFGGSAGREGTAVQIGGSVASALGRAIGLNEHETRLLLMAGIAAGFGAVFGTPLAGAIFAIEVLTVGKMNYEAIIPCLPASFVGDRMCMAWGTHHTIYTIQPLLEKAGEGTAGPVDALLTLKVMVAAITFGLAGVLFAELTHGLARLFHRIRWPLLRPVVGGAAVIGLAFLLGADYLGLGVTAPAGHVSIVSAFSPGGATPWSWLWKIILTAVTLSCGFKGGEVTPLFFVGATLGNVMAVILHAPVDLFAGLGFVAVFAGATNTPLACIVMGLELFGTGPLLYLVVACYLAYLFSGRSSIYSAQRHISMLVVSDEEAQEKTPA